MAFDEAQIYQLSGKLLKSVVRRRTGGGGRELDYIESWWAIEEANAIFGFDGWHLQILKVDTIWTGERPVRRYENGRPVSDDDGKPVFDQRSAVSAVAHVRIQVGNGDDMVVREDVGYGDGMDSDHGKAHELATKEAVSDAMKRALRTFGNKFGNGLYAKGHDKTERLFDPAGKSFDECKAAGVRISSAGAKNDGIDAKIKSLISEAQSVEDLDSRWEYIQDEYWNTLPLSWLNPMRDTYEAKREELQAKEA